MIEFQTHFDLMIFNRYTGLYVNHLGLSMPQGTPWNIHPMFMNFLKRWGLVEDPLYLQSVSRDLVSDLRNNNLQVLGTHKIRREEDMEDLSLFIKRQLHFDLIETRYGKPTTQLFKELFAGRSLDKFRYCLSVGLEHMSRKDFTDLLRQGTRYLYKVDFLVNFGFQRAAVVFRTRDQAFHFKMILGLPCEFIDFAVLTGDLLDGG